MKLDQKSDVYVADNAVPMGVDPNATFHLMEILSGLYKDGPESVLREYASNARDSHTAAGVYDPIEITLPSEDESLTIVDHGLGLTKQEMIDVFANYLHSTKRNSNDQVGAFGLGSKSAFTISNRFVVTAVKDGMRTVGIFVMSPTKGGTVSIASEQPTNASNGVTVEIDTDRYDDFARASKRVFNGWEPGTVLVNGSEPESIFDNCHALTDNVYVRESNVTTVRVVMGGVIYAPSSAMLEAIRLKHPSTLSFLSPWHTAATKIEINIIVPVGSVDITPSRESLKDTDKTIQAVTNGLTEFLYWRQSFLNKQIEHATTAFNAAKIALNYRFLVADYFAWNGKTYKFKENIPYPVMMGSLDGRMKSIVYEPNNSRTTPRDKLDKAIYVTDLPTDKTNDQLRRRLNTLLDQYSHIILVKGDPTDDSWWLFDAKNNVDTIAYNDVKAPVVQRNYTKQPIQYRVNGYSLTVDQINVESSPVFIYDENTPDSIDYSCFKPDTVRMLVLSGKQKAEVALKRINNSFVPTKQDVVLVARQYLDLIDYNLQHIDTTNTYVSRPEHNLAKIAENNPDIFGVKYRQLINNIKLKERASNTNSLTTIRRAQNVLGIKPIASTYVDSELMEDIKNKYWLIDFNDYNLSGRLQDTECLEHVREYIQFAQSRNK